MRGDCQHVTSCAHAGLTHLDFCSHSSRRDEDITDEGADALSGMTALRSLNLSGHKEVTTQGLGYLEDCSALTSLDLSGQLLSPSMTCSTLPVCDAVVWGCHCWKM